MKKLLSIIGYTEPTTFSELCHLLGRDRPADKSEWRELFIAIEELEDAELVEVERMNGKMESLQLTERGKAEHVRLSG